MIINESVRCARAKFSELFGLLTHRKMSLKLKDKFYTACIRSATMHGSETLALSVEQMARFDRTEMRMVRWMSDV